MYYCIWITFKYFGINIGLKCVSPIFIFKCGVRKFKPNSVTGIAVLIYCGHSKLGIPITIGGIWHLTGATVLVNNFRVFEMLNIGQQSLFLLFRLLGSL